LDRLLRRKADQGVKVYIVMYKEVAMALPLFSHQAKRHLLSLSPNIFVQRHPSRALDIFNKNSIFFWAHHEKICVVDNEVAFIGGLDQCFGRYDTPTHILIDDLKPDLEPTNDNPQVWPGKDYSNPRIIDFHTLDKPFEDNQDRTKLPRMPWHDVSMRIVGTAARDVSRHFVQRWNFLRRKKPSAPKRPTPMLLPAPDDYVNRLGNDDPRICHPHTSDSCRVQILRSVSPWSIGSINDHVEHSIQTAYCESIKNSKYFIYIENQFFVTSTKNGGTVIENNIGEAIYQRILHAYNEGTKWRAIIIVPLVPGFPANIDETEASTVRLIMQCQYLSIARGPDSILARLHAAGVTNTHEYINFYGLRNWAELNGQFVTEQVYIHAKTMVVDDMTVIIGSANINERSQLGTRDSEIAAYIQDDKDLVDSYFGGKRVKVGRYAHSLRMRLMCEHIGMDVDQIDREKYGEKKKKMMMTMKSSSSYMKQPIWADCQLDDDDKNDAINCIPPFIQMTKNLNKCAKEKEQIQQEEKDKPPMNEVGRESTASSSDSSATSSSNNSNITNKKKYGKRKKRHLLHKKNRKKIEQETVGQTAASANASANASAANASAANASAANASAANASAANASAANASAVNASADKNRISQSTSLEHVQTSKTEETTHTNSSSSGAGINSVLSPSISIFSKRKSTKEDYLDFWTSLDPDTDNNGDRKAWEEKRNTGKPKLDARAAQDLPYEPESNYYSSAKLEPLDTGKKTVGDIYRTIQDPLTDEFQDFWHMLARINTDHFRRSFLVTPDNNVRTWDQYQNYIKMAKMFLGRTDVKHGGTKTTAAAANVTTLPLDEVNGEKVTIHEILRHIRGHLVIWPNHFMEDDDGHNEFLFNVDKIVPLEIFD
jgi:phosphatidylserine/phosphatidylglycerophosphate/cardiolipin synthase-like enzyme